jgi:hypothetical protein
MPQPPGEVISGPGSGYPPGVPEIGFPGAGRTADEEKPVIRAQGTGLSRRKEFSVEAGGVAGSGWLGDSSDPDEPAVGAHRGIPH